MVWRCGRETVTTRVRMGGGEGVESRARGWFKGSLSSSFPKINATLSQ